MNTNLVSFLLGVAFVASVVGTVVVVRNARERKQAEAMFRRLDEVLGA